MRAILFLLLALGLAFSSSCLSLETAPQTIMSEEGINITLVILFTAFLIIGAYMVGKVTSNPRYTVFAKDEAYHLGFSVILLLAIGAILVFSCYTLNMFYVSLFENLELSSSCYSVPGQDMITVSSCYAKSVKSDAQALSEEYIDKYLEELMESTFTYTIQIPLMTSFSATSEAYRRVISNQYDIILNSFLIPAMLSISMQKLALDFIREEVLTWILPAAFLLRIFIPTRSLGNILIALVVGLYVVVPFMYVFNFAMYDAVGEECENNPAFQQAVCDNVVDDYDCANTCGNSLGFWNVGRLVPLAFFLPNLTIAVLVTFLASANKALRVIG